MQLKDFIANRDFDVNAEYAVYNGVWDYGGSCIWDSVQNGRLSSDDLISQYEITYVTVDVDTRKLIIEVA